MPRALFEKKGNAVWISHLDLMRVFQRSFKRAGLPLKHTQGFNPRPSVSIALPLSVGVQSECELLDFEVDGMIVSCDEIRDKLNEALIEGVRVLNVYENGLKIGLLSYLRCRIMLEYDQGVPENALGQIQELFSRTDVTVPKKTKSGIVDQNIIPMIRTFDVQQVSSRELQIDTRICCQNPTLNPGQIVLAIETYLPDMKPDFSSCSRLEIFDQNEKVFR